MMDLLVRVGAKSKTDFIFFDTGLEYQATKEHISFLNEKYDVEIEVAKPKKSIPACVKEYGVPFMSKFASEMIYRLQYNNFKFEDGSFDELYAKYPHCKTALEWWCNTGETDLYSIKRYPLLKEYIISNPPNFKISNKCCDYAKKKVSHAIEKERGYDLVCVGVRKAEGGIRNSFKSCFDERDGSDMFRPIFWF